MADVRSDHESTPPSGAAAAPAQPDAAPRHRDHGPLTRRVPDDATKDDASSEAPVPQRASPCDDTPPGLYPIGVVCSRLDINPVTLRAWERRYGLISPTRTAKGHRLYSDDDIERIRAVLELIAEGVPISQVSRAIERRRAQRAAAEAGPGGAESGAPSLEARRHRRAGLDTAVDFDLSGDPAARALFEAAAALDLERFQRVLKQLRLRLDWNTLYLEALPRLYSALRHGTVNYAEAEARLAIAGGWLGTHLARELESVQFVHPGPTALFAVFGSGHRRIPGLLLGAAAARAGLRIVLLDDVITGRALTVLARQHDARALVLHVSSQIVRSPQNQLLEDMLETCLLPVFLAGSAARGLAQIERSTPDLPRDAGARPISVLPDRLADAVDTLRDALGLSSAHAAGLAGLDSLAAIRETTGHGA